MSQQIQACRNTAAFWSLRAIRSQINDGTVKECLWAAKALGHCRVLAFHRLVKRLYPHECHSNIDIECLHCRRGPKTRSSVRVNTCTNSKHTVAYHVLTGRPLTSIRTFAKLSENAAGEGRFKMGCDVKKLCTGLDRVLAPMLFHSSSVNRGNCALY